MFLKKFRAGTLVRLAALALLAGVVFVKPSVALATFGDGEFSGDIVSCIEDLLGGGEPDQ